VKAKDLRSKNKRGPKPVQVVYYKPDFQLQGTDKSGVLQFRDHGRFFSAVWLFMVSGRFELLRVLCRFLTAKQQKILQINCTFKECTTLFVRDFKK
jgi:hypothetical protein